MVSHYQSTHDTPTNYDQEGFRVLNLENHFESRLNLATVLSDEEHYNEAVQHLPSCLLRHPESRGAQEGVGSDGTSLRDR